MYYSEISSINSLRIVRKHFEQYPLQTTKFVYFKLWCQVMDIIEKKEHLTKSGFMLILSIKSLYPKGLSPKLLEVYPKEKIIPLIKPIFEPSNMKLDLNWITGFTQADGTFGLNYTKEPRVNLGFRSLPQFRVTQHERDLIVLKRIIETMGCGTIVKPSGDRDRYSISVANISDLVTFFWKMPSLWCKKSRFFGFL
uniref:hypothetical protein n=1 Tax=Coccidioides immitis TaxID=5501 RepID=UPI001D00A05A|nr:hypothetical protein LI393_mgp18 [Coccidioides immitis]QVG62014.1 hypothetical protein [Coccidioides immitis]